MSYTPTNWKNGDVVTSTKLNKLEQGVANAGGVTVLSVVADPQTMTVTLNKTAGEVYEIFETGLAVLPVPEGDEISIALPSFYTLKDSGYAFKFKLGESEYSFECLTSDDYPAMSMNG